jgi:LCP family protein required for cell wall assembly
LKLFGGSGGHSGKKRRVTRMEERYERPVQPATPTAPKAPKPSGKKGGKAKQPLTKKQKRKRIAIVSVVVVALLAAVCAGAAWMLVRPPEIKNDPTIVDKENGDKVDVDSLLNSGQRVDDVFTFVVGAVDEDQTRTDALMVATMDTKKKTINIMNIPRDTMCNNGLSGASRKINAAYGMKKGIEQTKTEIERLVGFRPDKYVIVNFDGIAAIVDAIGGIDYEIPFRMQYDDPSQNLHIDLYAGMQHLTGKETVEFLRWRHNNDYSMQYPNGDQGRVENQQKFLKALAKEVFQLKNAPKIKSLASAVFDNVKTDLTAGQILWMGMQAINIKNENIQFFTLPGYGAMSYAGSDPNQYSFFFPYYDDTLKLVNQYFNPYEKPIETLDMVSGPESGSGGWVDSDDDVWGDTTLPSDDGETQEPSDGNTDPEGTGGTTEPENPDGSEPDTGITDPGETDPGTTDPGTTDPGTGETVSPEPSQPETPVEPVTPGGDSSIDPEA